MPTNPVPVLSDDEVAEVAAMFPHAEYQPTLSPDEVDPYEFCKGTIDDHKANCVVPHVHALCATVRALREQLTEEEQYSNKLALKVTLCEGDPLAGDPTKWGHESTITALREQLADAIKARDLFVSLKRGQTERADELYSRSLELLKERDELKDQLAQVTQERNEYRERLLKATETEVEI